MQYKIVYACVSHPGNVRQTNQDNFICNGQYMEPDGQAFSFPLCGTCVSKDQPLFGIFDGMGGEQCGEAAAAIAAKYASQMRVRSDGQEALAAFCRRANKAICNFSVQNGVSSTGTTAAMLLFGKKIFLCNIGDSKIFRLHKGELVQLSQDHLCLAPFGVKPPLSQNLGIPPEELKIEPYLRKFSYTVGETYLICSDGLTDMLSTEEIKEILLSNSPGSAVKLLLDQALANGGKDNTSIILCKIEKEPWRLLQRKTTAEKRGKNNG